MRQQQQNVEKFPSLPEHMRSNALLCNTPFGSDTGNPLFADSTHLQRPFEDFGVKAFCHTCDRDLGSGMAPSSRLLFGAVSGFMPGRQCRCRAAVASLKMLPPGDITRLGAETSPAVCRVAVPSSGDSRGERRGGSGACVPGPLRSCVEADAPLCCHRCWPTCVQ